MKTTLRIFGILFLFSVFGGIFGCQDRILETKEYIANKPVYMTYEDMRSGIKSLPATDLEKTGKFYFYNNYVLVNEYLKGIHIIDNSDPSNPQNIKFVEIPGNIDMAVKDGYLYVDSYVDLVVLNINNIEDITEVYRIENVFPYQVPEYDYNYPLAVIDRDYGVVVGYSIEKVKETYETTGEWGFGFYRYDEVLAENVMYDGSGGTGGQGVGIAGSMARFCIYEDNIYLLNELYMYVYDISNLRKPVYFTELITNTVAETLFLYDTKLFMGTQTGMKVFSLSNPGNPEFISEFEHIQSCDPVVVLEDYAYVTLRAGNACGGFENQLDVIDISNIYAPELVKSYEMTSPYGLGITIEKTLFVCDGDDGLKVYDASDPLEIDENMLYHFPQINAFDVIPFGNLIMMIGADGLYQYNFEEGNLTQISYIPIGE